MIRSLLAGGCIFALAVCITALPEDVQSCGGAYRSGESVDVADETALIVWDEANKTEHFIRTATFVGSAYDFGFLVPTPTAPKLESADSELFTDLATITKPKTEYREQVLPSFGCGLAAPAAKSEATPAGAVVVLEQKRVGNLDATVLGFRTQKGEDPKQAASELLVWLNRNQYAVRPDLEEWLLPYIRSNWVITAFKIVGQPPSETPVAPKGTGKSVEHAGRKGIGLKSETVLMSFKTDRPFFPYREPADRRDPASLRSEHRLLRVYVAAKQRMAGKLGDGTKSWPGQTVWANTLADYERDNLLQKTKLPGDVVTNGWWLTEFEDRSSPRPGTDEVYFEPSADSSVVARRPQIITVLKDPWWVGLVCIGVPLLMAGGLIVGSVLLFRFAWRRRTT